MTRRRRSTAWLTAWLALEQAMRQRLGDDIDVDIDRVTKAGEGLDRSVYVSDIEAQSSTGDIRGRFAVLLPRGDAPLDLDDRARREVALLDRLTRLDLPFEIPRWSTTVEQGDRAVLVREFLGGVPLSEGLLPSDEFPLWDITGEIAAAVHAIPTADLALVVGGYGTRRDHVAALLRETVDFVPDSVTGDAIEWIRSHMPPAEPAVFLHGDLLGQNILVDLDGNRAVIDWEYSVVGDPAYDLAIVTRGLRRPFKRSDGLRLLLDAYRSASGVELQAREIHVHELLLHIRWHQASCRGEGQHPREVTLEHLRGVLARAARSESD
jgi:aminoglycoside phosphotransferase (APT) family kinase protein